MTISSSNRKAGPFTGNGVTTAFPFTFKVFTTADLLVVLANTSTGAEVTQTLTTNYTVSLNADQNANPGGTVTMLVAPATGYTLTLTSQVAQTQAVDLTNAGGFYPSVINIAFDKLTILIQQMQTYLTGALKLPLSASGVSATLPTPSAGKLLGWSTDALSITNLDATGVDLTAIQNSTYQTIGSVAGTNTITGTVSPSITGYAVGQTFRFVAAAANTGAVTININGQGAKAITKSGSTALVAGDIASGAAVQITYDGTQFQLVSGAGSGGASAGGVIYENSRTITSSYTMTTSKSGTTVGPMTVATGQTLTVPTGEALIVFNPSTTGTGTTDVLTTGAQTFQGQKTFAAPATFGSAQMPTPSGSAPVYGARAWCSFNGALTGTNAPLAGGNISTVTRNSTGNYTVTFTTPMPDANYAVSVTGGANGAQSGYVGSVSASSFTVVTFTTSTLALTDVNPFYVVVYR